MQKLLSKYLSAFVPLCLGGFFFLSGCTAPTLSRFEVQRPSRITVPREVQKVFIRADLVAATNDKLSIKSQVLQQLVAELNRIGRFKVSVVQTLDESRIDPEKETVAVIQGEVISGGEVDRGQFTDLATCTGGIGGRISSAGAAALTDEAITLDRWRGHVCREGGFVGNVAETALSSAFALAGLGEGLPAKNQAVRVYEYKNLSLFAQANFSFTVIGAKRETLAIRADAASFGRSVRNKKSYRNVQEGFLAAEILGSLITSARVPIFPIPIRQAALAERSKPKQTFYDVEHLPVPGIHDLPSGEKQKIVGKLVNRTLESFIRTISPYRVTVGAEVASGGKADAEDLLKAGKAKQVRKRIEALPDNQREAEDWYNLGLAYEASAVSVEDYEDARRFYITALRKSPGTPLYAQGVGRTRRYLAEAGILAKQTQK